MRSWFQSVKSYVKEFVDPEFADFRDQWLSVQAFYEDVQKASDEKSMEKLRKKLPWVEEQLQLIIGSLVREVEHGAPIVLETEAGDCRPSELESIASGLPPCYRYLLRQSSSAASGRDPNVVMTEGHDNDDVVIFNICQYAKHDQPVGTRSIMLRALHRILSEVDAKQGGSMLLLCPEYITLPLCDMILKVSIALDPQKAQGATSAPPDASPSKKRHASATTPGSSVEQDRFLFVALLRCLCEKVEQCNGLATYFTLPTGKGSSTLLLLEKIVPYVYDSAVAGLSQVQRFETYSGVLRGVLSLAKSPSDDIQRAVADRADIHFAAQDVLRAAFLTICKVPDHSEVRLHTACVMETVRWMEALIQLLPSMAESWEVRKYLQQEFLCCTVLPLFRTPDERAYLAVTTLVIHILKDALPANAYIVNLIALALLQSRVSNEHQEIFLFQQSAIPSDFETTTRSFAEEYLWPRLMDVSDDVVCATLQLLTALASKSPHYFMVHALKLDAVRKPLFFSRQYLQNLIENYGADLPSVIGSLDSVEVKDGKPPLKSRRSGMPPSMSAANPLLPNIVINDYFPEPLRTDRGLCGSSADDFIRDALQLILELDGALSPEEGNLHRTRVERAKSIAAKRAQSPHASPTGTGSKSLTERIADRSESAPVVNDTAPFCLGTAAVDPENVFFDPCINDAPLVSTCCELIKSILEHPFTVNALLSELVTLLCALPDIRVLFTLLDPEQGRFAIALRSVQCRVVGILDRDQKDFLNGNAASVSRRALFDRCVQRPFFDPSDETFGGDEAVANLMRTSKVFVEACVCLEGLRHELNAVGAYQVVSQRFSELSPGIQRSS